MAKAKTRDHVITRIRQCWCRGAHIETPLTMMDFVPPHQAPRPDPPVELDPDEELEDAIVALGNESDGHVSSTSPALARVLDAAQRAAGAAILREVEGLLRHTDMCASRDVLGWDTPPECSCTHARIVAIIRAGGA